MNADDVLLFAFQSYLVKTPHHTILIDTCIGNDKPRARPSWNMRSDESYLRALNAAGVGVGDIDYVMCTHLHPDHIGWNTRLDNGRWVPTFPNARYIFGDAEYKHWSVENETKDLVHFADSVLPVVEARRADLVANDFNIGDHVRLFATPGHTPGHVAIALGRGRDDAIMSGDAVHSPLQMRYPELSPRFDNHPEQAAATRRALFERCCDTDTLLCTAHFPSPSAGRVKRWGDGFKCEMI